MANLAPTLVYWHRPAPLFVARVNAPGAIVYPVQDIAFDSTSAGSYLDCTADMTVLFGSAPLLDDYGRGRLRAAPTSTILKVNRSSQGVEDGSLDIVDNAYITVLDDFRVWSKIATIGFDHIERKDTDLEVGDLTAAPPPVAVLGPDRARRIDATSGLVRFYFDGGNSYAVADGATITDYAWDIGDGTFVLGTSATDSDIFADFPAGVRYISLTITDSNGKQHSGRRLVLAHDPANSLCVSGMQVQRITRTQTGLSVPLRLLQDLPRSQFPDGAHVLIFEDRDPNIFGTPSPSDWSDLLFSGWHNVDEASSTAQETHLRRETVLTCVDVLGRLDGLPGFPQRLEVPDEVEGLTWGEMPAANMDKFLVYLIHWHSTAASVADFFPSGTWDEYPFVLFDASGDTLYNQLQRQAARIVPDHNFTSDRYGRMEVVVNPQYQNPPDRTAVTQNSLTEQAWSAIEFNYNRHPRVHTLRGSALLTQTEWLIIDDDKALVEPVFAIAPGTAPGQGGREQKLGERLAKSQQDLNDTIGHHYAHMNARYGDIIVTLNLNADPWDFDPAAFTWVQLITTAATAPQRGLDFETIRCLVKEVSIDYTYGEEATTWRGRVVLERETVGLPALTEEQEPALPVGEEPVPVVPPSLGLITGQELLAGLSADGMLYVTSDFQTLSGSGGPTYAEHDLSITDTTLYSWVVDPFSPGYINQDGTGAVNAWAVGDTNLWRITDIFGTPGASIVHTFAVALGTSSVPAQEWRTVQASFGAFFPTGNPWLMVVSHYRDASGHTGTWALYSVDGGASFGGEVQITPHYDTSTGTSPRPLALYLSPKTPGHALAVAYTATANPAPARGIVTAGWGASWTPLVVVDAGVRLGGDYHVPWLAAGDATIYHGKMAGGAATDPALMPSWGYFDSGTGTYTPLTDGASATMLVSATDDVPGGGSVTEENRLVLAPPATTKRVKYTVAWSAGRSRTNVFSTTAHQFVASKHTTITQTGDMNYVNPNYNASTAGIGDFELTFTGGDWPANRDSVVTSPPTAVNQLGAHVLISITAVAAGSGGSASQSIDITVTVTEIELDDGTIYVPVAESTRAFSLRRVNPDTSVDDVSPVSGGVNFGPNAPHFSIRAYDSGQQYLALGGTGNDTSGSSADDLVGAWVSDDTGASWNEIIAPVAAANAPQGVHVAFAGDTSDVLYVFGGKSDGSLSPIYYTSNFGVSLDDRGGNLESSFGGVALIGICGGPIGGA